MSFNLVGSLGGGSGSEHFESEFLVHLGSVLQLQRVVVCACMVTTGLLVHALSNVVGSECIDTHEDGELDAVT